MPMTKEEKLEARLANTERLLIGMTDIIKSDLSVHKTQTLDRMVLDYFKTNITLGATFPQKEFNPFKSEGDPI